MNEPGISSHVEGYICAIQEQEINTRKLQQRREGTENCDGKCRHCHIHDEDIFHILCSCGSLSESLYLPARHNEVGKSLYNAIIQKYHSSEKFYFPSEIYVTPEIEIWWDIHVNVYPRVQHDRPDIVLWDIQQKKCVIIDIVIPLDMNVEKNEKVKRNTYVLLSAGLKRLYSNYSFEIIPIAIGATGYVPNSLTDNLKMIGFSNEYIPQLIRKLLRKALCGSMKVVKTAMQLK